MNFSWDLIHTFEKVADTGSLLAASRALGLSQPTVGRHIDLLEQSLNVSLFIRSRSGMKLTDAGSNLVATSRDMVRSAEEFKRQSLGLDDKVSGVVRISANEILGVRILPRLIAEFLDANPGVEIELDINNSAANLLRRDADIALRMFQPVQNDLIARKIMDIPVGFYAHRDYLAKNGTPLNFADLREHRLVGFDREMTIIHGAKQLGEALSASDFVFRCDNILAHIEAVRAGVGIGIIQQGMARTLDNVVHVLEELDPPPLGLWIVCHSEVQYNKRVRLLMDFLAVRLKPLYGADFTY
jgi:DNA-binding transcriptional LysR family regulator